MRQWMKWAAQAACVAVTLAACARSGSINQSREPSPAPAHTQPAAIIRQANPLVALQAAARPGLSAITGNELEADTRFLADDLLEGRAPGTRGHELAAAYVASRMRSMGLEPAGANGTFLQPVPLRAVKRVDSGCQLTVRERAGARVLKADEDVVFPAFTHAEQVKVSGEIVYLGFGLEAPEFNYSDIAGVDLRGKIAAIYWGAPKSRPNFFPGIERAVYSDGIAKGARLKALGAVAVLVIVSPELLKIHPWKATVEHFRFERLTWLEGDTPGAGLALPSAIISPATFERLAQEAKVPGGAARLWEQADLGQAKPLPLGINAELKVRSAFSPITSPNVLGLLRGSDPVRNQEVLLLTAHLDHFGVGQAEGKDKIFNGAIDNACGVSVLLATARGLTALPERPHRSVLFMATTGEEQSLMGSDYFATHPTVPLQNIVANINLDGSNPMHEMFDVVPFGAEHSTLGAHVSLAAEAMGVSISPDPAPEMVLFLRSDQYSFAKRGITAVFPVPGDKDAHGEPRENRKAIEKWFAEKYHQPSDEWQPEYRGDYLAKEARFSFMLTVSVANAADKPEWHAGDFFARHRW